MRISLRSTGAGLCLAVIAGVLGVVAGTGGGGRDAAAQQGQQPAEPKQDGPQPGQGQGDRGAGAGATAKAAVERAATEAVPTPFPIAENAEEWPGDGKPFPLVVEFVDRKTRSLIKGTVSAGYSLAHFHPRTPPGTTIRVKWESDPEGARATFRAFHPGLYTFRLDTEWRLPVSTVEAWVPEAPAGNKLSLALTFLELRGRVEDGTGAPLPLASVRVNGQGSELLKEFPGRVRSHQITAEAWSSEEDGGFVFPALCPGCYLLISAPVKRAPRGRWVPQSPGRVLTLMPGTREPLVLKYKEEPR